MNDIENAIRLLKNYGYTCVLCKGESVHTSCVKGISPMLDFIREGLELEGFSVADKIVGKAAAMLFVLVGVKSVYGEVMSREGQKFLEKHDVDYSYGVLTEKIINRKGDGVCPMEQTVAEIDDIETAYTALLEKRSELRGEK